MNEAVCIVKLFFIVLWFKSVNKVLCVRLEMFRVKCSKLTVTEGKVASFFTDGRQIA